MMGLMGPDVFWRVSLGHFLTDGAEIFSDDRFHHMHSGCNMLGLIIDVINVRMITWSFTIMLFLAVEFEIGL